jgi:hypothetical protein
MREAVPDIVKCAKKLLILPIFSAGSFSEKLFSRLQRLLFVVDKAIRDRVESRSGGDTLPGASNWRLH